MTGVRQSYVFAREASFGKGNPDPTTWIAVPPGSFISFTHNRSVEKIYGAGSKKFDTLAYGTVNGSFEWTFTLDYDYMEPLTLAYESYTCTGASGKYRHELRKTNSGRVPSFVIRRKILNEVAGGPAGSDEISDVRGCFVKNIRFSNAAGSSKTSVTITGTFADEQMRKTSLSATDWTPYEGNLVEYMCMFIGEPTCENYAANVESLNISVENNAGAIYSTCTPIARNYFEGRTDSSISATVYSNDPSIFKQRLYSGGYDDTALHPLAKDLRPIPAITLMSYNTAVRDGDGANLAECLSKATRSFRFDVSECAVKSVTWQKGDGSKLVDTISSSDCKDISIVIENDCPNLVTDSVNKVSSAPAENL